MEKAQEGLAALRLNMVEALAWVRSSTWSDHQQACVCAECEAATRRTRLLDQVNSGQYEAEGD